MSKSMPTTDHGIITYSFVDNYIEKLADYIDQTFVKQEVDLKRLAIVFGGKRPSLFLKRELSKRLGQSYYSPRFFSIDEFISFSVTKREIFKNVNDLDASYVLYKLAYSKTPELLKGRESFAEFLPWTKEVLSFIDQLDLENISVDALQGLKENAEIGYSVPDDINTLLEHIMVLRFVYHEYMEREKIYSRGYQYLKASRLINQISFEEYDRLLFCNFFYLNRSEETVIKNLYDRNQATLIFQGDEKRWPVLKRISKDLDHPIVEGPQVKEPKFDLNLHAGFDKHSQIGLVREILKETSDLSKTVIVLPNADMIIPLMAEITSLTSDFNISMGYPLKRSSLYTLLQFVFRAQNSKKDSKYYAKDYLKVLRHPLVKSLKFQDQVSIARVFVHRIEEVLTGQESSDISGSLFVNLKEIEGSEELYELILDTLKRMGIKISKKELKSVIKEIHDLLFRRWEGLSCFSDFAINLEEFLETFVDRSFLSLYPLNNKITEKILLIVDELKAAYFKEERFVSEDIFSIFDRKIEREIVSFIGSPLKGLQILGLFETRSLNFENVIVLDVNEGVLPRLRIYEPLIPREVMISLNLDRLELEEEIQRYQFMRLISSAKNVHLVYQEGKDKEKSRFVEELIWEQEQKNKKINSVDVLRPSFEVKPSSAVKRYKKTPEMIKFLKEHTYSASSINTYLRDPIEFYFNYCLGLREKEDLLNEPENREVGTFIHDLLEDTFTGFVGKKPVLDKKFQKRFMKVFEDRFENTFGRSMKSDSFLLKSVMADRLKRFLDKEMNSKERDINKVLYIEKRFEDKIKLPCGEVKFVYRVDRVDEMTDGSIMILDYKTGSVDPMPKALEKVKEGEFSRESILENVRSFQMPLYFYYLDRTFKDKKINAAFYNLRTMELNKFIGPKMTQDHEKINSVFLNALNFVMSEILNPEVDFVSNEI